MILQKTLYLIKWKGYSVEESTWEPEGHLNCPAIIAKYNAKIAAQRIDDDNYDQEDETESEDNGHQVNHKKSSSKARASRIISSPSSSVSKSPKRDYFPSSPSRDLSPSRMYSKPSGISNFFKPTAATLPASFSDDSVRNQSER